MPRGELPRRPKVDDVAARLEHGRKPFGREPLRARQAAQRLGPLLVHPLHQTEIGRRLRLPGENPPHEVVLVLDGEGPVEPALVAHGTVWHRAQPLAAGGARAVAGPDLEPVGLRLEPLQAAEQGARRLIHRALHVRGALQQVGAPHVTDEHEVRSPRRSKQWRRRRSRGRRARGVPRRMEHARPHAPTANSSPRAAGRHRRRANAIPGPASSGR
jgi:hypothetical protein